MEVSVLYNFFFCVKKTIGDTACYIEYFFKVQIECNIRHCVALKLKTAIQSRAESRTPGNQMSRGLGRHFGGMKSISRRLEFCKVYANLYRHVAFNLWKKQSFFFS